jgi:hypothetical protein
MRTERVTILVGKLYDPMNAELAAGRRRAGGLRQVLNATREAGQDERRRIVSDLFWSGVDTVLVQPPFHCEARERDDARRSRRRVRRRQSLPRHPSHHGGSGMK